MKKKRLVSFFLILSLTLWTSSALAADAPGSAKDPLISKSYIDNTYPSIVLTDPLDMLANSMTVLKYKLNQALSSTAKGIYIINAMPGGKINLVTGSGFIMISGSSRLTSSSGTVIDLTSGEIISAGQQISAGHRYIAAENTQSAVSVEAASKIAILGNTTYSGASTPSFTDVSDKSWFYGDVCYAVQKGLINGRSNTVFAPDDNLSIAEAIKLASCMNQLYNTGSVTLKNDSSLWYKSYVDYALQNAIITVSYSNYDAKITRSEFVKIFYRALPESEYTPKNTVADNAIPDVKTAESNASQIYAFYRAGILTGSDAKGTFYPNSNIKRSEVAAILTRMFEKDARKSITLS
ncbi:MAG: S-layer homology domain-containing protein [Clostridiales bacterium]|nr:S-layer homology domain-containing protein [Clostridiales bacterium]